MRKRTIKPKPPTESTEKARTTISLPPELLDAGSKRAAAERRNFSNYIESLIDRDLKAAGAVA